MQIDRYYVRISYLTPVLALNPASDLAQQYILKKAEKELEKLERQLKRLKNEEQKMLIEKEIERLKVDLEMKEEMRISEEEQKSRLQIFARTSEGYLADLHYQIKGFMKEVALQYFSGALKNQISKYVDICPVEETGDYRRDFFILYKRNGEPIKEPDSLLSRSLRSWAHGQYIVTIVWSEMLDLPLEQEFVVKVYAGKLTDKQVLDIFARGEVWGKSGWRGAKYGRFKIVEFERMNDVKKKVITIKKEAKEM
ncbi:TPA: hypothetical protein [Aquificae Conch Spring virus]|nr:TPA: hypothetical protein [Aquificae Conch Spring virus]